MTYANKSANTKAEKASNSATPTSNKENTEALANNESNKEKDFASLTAEITKEIPAEFMEWIDGLPNVISKFVLPEIDPSTSIESNAEGLRAIYQLTPLLVAKLALLKNDADILKQLENGEITAVVDKLNPNNLSPQEQKLVNMLKAMQSEPNSPVTKFFREKLLPDIIREGLNIKQEGEKIAGAVTNAENAKKDPDFWEKTGKFISENPGLTVGLAVGGGLLAYAAYQFFKDDNKPAATNEPTTDSNPTNSITNNNLFKTILGGGLTLGGLYAAGHILNSASVREALKDGALDPNDNRITQALIHFSNLRLLDGLYTIVNGADKNQLFTEAKAKEMQVEPLVIRIMSEQTIGALVSNRESFLPKEILGMDVPAEYFTQEQKLRENLKKSTPRPAAHLTYRDYLASPTYTEQQERKKGLVPNTANEQVNAARTEKSAEIQENETERLAIRSHLDQNKLTTEDLEHIKSRTAVLQEKFDNLVAESPGFLENAMSKLEDVLPEYFEREHNEQDKKYQTELIEHIKTNMKLAGSEADRQMQVELAARFARINKLLALKDVEGRSLSQEELITANTGFTAFEELEEFLETNTVGNKLQEKQQADIHNQRSNEAFKDAGEIIDLVGFTTIWGFPLHFVMSAQEGDLIETSIYAVPVGAGLYGAGKGLATGVKEGSGVAGTLGRIGWGYVKGQSLGVAKLVTTPLKLSKDAFEYIAPKCFARFVKDPGMSFVKGTINYNELMKHVNGHYNLRTAYKIDSVVTLSTEASFKNIAVSEIVKAINGTHTDPQRAKEIIEKLLLRQYRDTLSEEKWLKTKIKLPNGEIKTGLQMLTEIEANDDLARFFARETKVGRGLLLPATKNLTAAQQFLDAYKRLGNPLLELITANEHIAKALSRRNKQLLQLLNELPVEALPQLKTITNLKEIAVITNSNNSITIVTKSQFAKIIEGTSDLPKAVQDASVNQHFTTMLTDNAKRLNKIETTTNIKLAAEIEALPPSAKTFLARNPKLLHKILKNPQATQFKAFSEAFKKYTLVGKSTEFLSGLEKNQTLVRALTVGDSYTIEFFKTLNAAEEPAIALAKFDPEKITRLANIKALINRFPLGSEARTVLEKLRAVPNNPQIEKFVQLAKTKSSSTIAKAIKYGKATAKVGGNVLTILGPIMSLLESHTYYEKAKKRGPTSVANNASGLYLAEAAVVPGLVVGKMIASGATYTEAVAATGPMALAVAPVAITLGVMMNQVEKTSDRWLVTMKEWNEKLEKNQTSFYQEFVALTEYERSFADVVIGTFTNKLKSGIENSNLATRRRMWETLSNKFAPTAAQSNIIAYIQAKTNGSFNFDRFQSGNIFNEAVQYAMLLDAAKIQREINQKNPEQAKDHLVVNDKKIPLTDLQPIHAQSVIDNKHEDSERYKKLQGHLVELNNQQLTQNVANEITWNEQVTPRSLGTIAISSQQNKHEMYLGSLNAYLTQHFASDEYTPEEANKLRTLYYEKLLTIAETKISKIPLTEENIPQLITAIKNAQDEFTQLSKTLYYAFEHAVEEDMIGNVDFSEYQRIVNASLTGAKS